jgi:iron-sulfur cluster insertion protein
MRLKEQSMAEHMSGETGPITISDSAVSRIVALQTQENEPDAMLRVTVSGGGCAGFQYGFDFAHKIADDDVVVEKGGISVIVDPSSLMFLFGSEVDYVEDLIGSFFTLNNPNATSTCGCGTSFAV